MNADVSKSWSRLAALWFGLVVVACGGDEKAGTGTDTSADATVPGDPERPIEVVREFRCDPTAIVGEVDVAEVHGAAATLALRPAGAGPCTYDLLYKEAGQAVVLSAEPASFLLTIAGKAPSGRVVVCASEVEHTASDGLRRTERARIVCAAREPGAAAFSALSPVVTPDGAWAAWVLGLEEGASDYRLVWGRDFSFQFFNTGGLGRPPEDGLYATSFVFDGGFAVGSTEKVGPFPEPAAEDFGGWAPTGEELEAFKEWVPDTSDGECAPPLGCPE